MTGPDTAVTAPPRAVGLVVHGGRAEARAAAAAAARTLQTTGVEVVGCADDNWREAGVDVRTGNEFGEGLDVVLVFGGDGTFLRAAYLARDVGVPLLGVNLGRLGFLSEVEAHEVDDAIKRLVDGDFYVEQRMTLAVEIRDADGVTVGSTWALNEASVERLVPQRLIILEVLVGDAPFHQVPADALICATPTGSTAYAFSAGGPILSPLVDAILLVPVAPHSLFSRTIVVDPAETLSVRAVGTELACVVSCDGRESIPVPSGGCVTVSRGHLPVHMARLRPFDFYGRVREKFGLR